MAARFEYRQAQELAAAVEKVGGLMTAADLAAYRVVRRHRNWRVSGASIRGFERRASGSAEPHGEVTLEGLDEKLAVSRRQWSAVRAIAAEKGTITE